MREMTSRERLWAAIEGRPVDRIPVAPRIWRYGLWKGRTILDLARQFGFDAVYTSAHGNCLETPLSDPLCERVGPLLGDVGITISTRREGAKTYAERTFRTPQGTLHDVLVIPDPGGEYGMLPNPEWLEPLVKTRADVELLGHLLPGPRHMKAGLERARQLDAEVGNEGLVSLRPTMGMDNIVVDALGVANALILSLDDPVLLDRLIEIVDAWHMAAMRQALEDGWKIIYDAWFNFALGVGWSPRFYRQKAAPVIKRHAELAHAYGAKLFLYDDGKMRASIGEVIAAGADIIQTIPCPPSGDMDYRWLAANYGGQACLNCGVDTVKIRFGTPEEIAADVRECMEVLGPTRRYVLGTSDSITEKVPDENMRAFFTTAREAGTRLARQFYG